MTLVRDGSIGERIASSYADLTPQEQRAADFMLGNLSDLALYNGSELASLSGVSKATVSRLFRRLGFENSLAVRDHVRALHGSGVPDASVSLRSTAGLGQVLDREIANLTAALGSLDVAECSRGLVAAQRVLVLGFRNSYPVALHLREQLAQARAGVTIAPQPGQSLSEELVGLGPEDAIVIVGFRRRPAGFDDLVAAAVATGAVCTMLTDARATGHPRGLAHVIECPLDAGSAFDSYASAVAIVCVIASTVLELTGREGADRVDSIARTYRRLGELEQR